jgi:hypothetical protein
LVHLRSIRPQFLRCHVARLQGMLSLRRHDTCCSVVFVDWKNIDMSENKWMIYDAELNEDLRMNRRGYPPTDACRGRSWRDEGVDEAEGIISFENRVGSYPHSPVAATSSQSSRSTGPGEPKVR